MVTYQVLPQSIMIFENGKVHCISSSDPRYNLVKKNLNNLKPEHFEVQLPKGFAIKNNCLHFYKFRIPAKIETYMFQNSNRDALLNFWANISSRCSIEETTEVFNSLILGNLKPVSKNGFVMVCKSGIKHNQIKDLTFLNSDSTNSLMEIESFDSFIGFDSSYWNKAVFTNEISRIVSNLNLDNSEGLSLRDFNIIKFWSDFSNNKKLNLDQTVWLLRQDFLKDHNEVFNLFLHTIIDQFLKNKSNTFSKDRLSNLLNHPDFLDLFSKYSLCLEKRISFNFEDLSFDKCYEAVKREYERIRHDGTPLGIIAKNPEIKNLHNLKVESKHFLIVPSFDVELVEWGSYIRNCVGNGTYARMCISGNGYILGLSNGFKIIASIQVKIESNLNHKITQFEGLFSDTGHKLHLHENDSLWISVQSIIDEKINKKTQEKLKTTDKKS